MAKIFGQRALDPWHLLAPPPAKDNHQKVYSFAESCPFSTVGWMDVIFDRSHFMLFALLSQKQTAKEYLLKFSPQLAALSWIFASFNKLLDSVSLFVLVFFAENPNFTRCATNYHNDHKTERCSIWNQKLRFSFWFYQILSEI